MLPVSSSLKSPTVPTQPEEAFAPRPRSAGLSTVSLGTDKPSIRRAPLYEKKKKVLERIRHIRGGKKLNDARWGTRTKGEGIFAEQIRSMFEVACRRAGIGARPTLSTAAFCRLREQLDLFR